MHAKTIWVNGNQLAKKCINTIKQTINKEKDQHRQFYQMYPKLSCPQLNIINIGSDIASLSYIKKKIDTASLIGIRYKLHQFVEKRGDEHLIMEKFGRNLQSSLLQNCHFQELSLDQPLSAKKTISELINNLNKKQEVSGILMQLPLKPSLQPSTSQLLNQIHPYKDVDCLSSINRYALLDQQNPTLLPCTPAAVLTILDQYGIKVQGKKVVIVGRSNLVGLPLFHLLLNRNATITLCHIHTQNLGQIVKEADILISAVGKPNLITQLKPSSVVIDIGITRNQQNKLCGDIPQEIKSKCSFATPVPGGVGPLTVSMLMRNTVFLWQSQMQKKIQQQQINNKDH